MTIVIDENGDELEYSELSNMLIKEVYDANFDKAKTLIGFIDNFSYAEACALRQLSLVGNIELVSMIIEKSEPKVIFLDISKISEEDIEYIHQYKWNDLAENYNLTQCLANAVSNNHIELGKYLETKGANLGDAFYRLINDDHEDGSHTSEKNIIGALNLITMGYSFNPDDEIWTERSDEDNVILKSVQVRLLEDKLKKPISARDELALAVGVIGLNSKAAPKEMRNKI